MGTAKKGDTTEPAATPNPPAFETEALGAPPPTISEAFVVFIGTSWAKGEEGAEAIKLAFGYEKPSPGRKYRMNVMRIQFPAPEANLNRVLVDGMGTVSFPAGSKVTKWEAVEIPSKVVDSFTAFDLAFEEWTENGNSAVYPICYPDD
jgi:hypothetical protein